MATKTPMTTNQSFLHMVDSRLIGLKYNQLRPNENLDAERVRMEAARADVLSRMDQAEQDQYIKMKTTELTPAEKRAAAEAERLAMEANRDKPSI